MSAPPKLTAAVVVGDQRERAEEGLARLLAQTAIESMEIVVVDLAPEKGKLAGVGRAEVRYVPCPGPMSYGEARAESYRHARGEIFASIEDHCFASPRWAEALIGAYRNRVDVVSYVFAEGEEGSYVTRSFLFTEYGRWMSPARRGPIEEAPCNNVSYRRKVLAQYEEELGERFEVEYTMHREIVERGGTIWIEPDAEVVHQDWQRFSEGFRANAALKRLYAASRVANERWGWARRLFYAAAMPLSPPLHLWRLARSVWNRPALWPCFVSSFPLAVAVYVYASYHEALGYLFGAGQSREQFRDLEVVTDRR